MTPKVLKKRLDEQAKFFRSETDFVKGKARALYLLARDAVKTAERLESELHDLRNPKLSENPVKAPLPADAPEPRHESKSVTTVEWLKGLLKDGTENNPNLDRYLKITGNSLQQVLKIVESADQNI